MKVHLQNNGSDNLILFFCGWGMDENPFSVLKSSCDVLYVYDYVTTDFPEFDFSKYKSVKLLSFSYGVYAGAIAKLPDEALEEILYGSDERIKIRSSLIGTSSDYFVAFDGVVKYIQLVQDRDEIFKQSDYVSLHVPATPETIHSVSDREFDLMKETAYLINAARGSIVDEPALVRALQEGKIAGAGLDTLEKEPIDPANPLVAMDNVLTAPHIGGATKEASSRSSVACAQAIDDYFSGRTPKFVVPELRDLIQK